MDTVKSWHAIVALNNAKRKPSPCCDDKIAFSRRTLLAVVIRVLVYAVFILQAFMPHVVHAQNGPEPTKIKIGAPAQTHLGATLTVQAVLVDGRGNPISKATIYFITHMTFLKNTGDVVLAQAVTNKNGQAVAQFVDDSSGLITLSAEFRGDAQYAASNATTKIETASQEQVYIEHVGVDIPGFNVPPVIAPGGSVQSSVPNLSLSINRLWPMMNGWPIALVLIIVWSMYFIAVTFIYRIATPESEVGENKSTLDRWRSP